MKKRSFYTIVAALLAVCIVLGGCGNVLPAQPLAVAAVQRGNLEVKVSADGNIEMPAAVNLYFDISMFTPPYSSRIKDVYVEKGDIIRAGALLAKLDDTTQRLAVESAQYALELAINNVVQTTCCGVNRSPGFYCDAVALLRFEFAQKELEKARILMQAGKYEDAAVQILLAKFDLEGARKFYSDPAYRTIRPDLIDVTQAAFSDVDIDTAISRLGAEINILLSLQILIKDGQYQGALDGLQTMLTEMGDTHSVVKRLNHLPQAMTYPDTCTGYTMVNEIQSSLDALQELAGQKDVDGLKLAETISLVRHDVELTEKILDENISTFRQGLNLKTLRDYNIAVQAAIINLQRAKQALLKTELLAPFDGRITDINLRAGDMITQRYLVTGVPIDSYVIQLTNTNLVKMTGLIDEIDVVKIVDRPLSELRTVVLVDAFPGRQFKGKVKFISPFGPTQAGGIQYYGTVQTTYSTYKVEITLDPAEAAYLTGGLTATAEILINNLTDVLLVPKSAIAGQAGSYTVRVLTDEKTGLMEERPVIIGVQNREHVEVLSGLNEGEKVVLEKNVGPARVLHN
jgi:RND family efflux transporter MFP subunit